MLSMALLLGTLVLAETAPFGITDKLLQAEREKAAKQWAPVVWLHPDENFFPSSVNDFLRHIKPSKAANNGPWNTVDGDESAILMSSLPVGRPSRGSFLLAPHDFKCSNCPLPKFLFGKKPGGHDSPSVYAIIHSCSMQPTRRESRSTYGLDFEHYDFLSDSGENENPLPLQRERQRGHQTTKHMSTAPTKTLGVSHFITLSDPFKRNNVTSLNDTLSDNLHEITPSSNSNNGDTSVNILDAASSNVLPSTDVHENTTNPETNNQIPISRSTIGQFFQETTINRLNASSSTNYSINSSNEVFNNIKPFKKLVDPETYTGEVNMDSRTSSLSEETQQNDNSNQEVNIQDDQHTSNIQKVAELHHSSEKRHTPSASVDEALPYQQHFTITYWMFYPYNNGKNICSTNFGYFLGHAFKPRVNGACHGEEVTIGDHVGDWEHVSIQFKASIPIQMYVSTHTFGAYYTYDPSHHEFLYAGEDFREGIPLSPSYPRTVQLTGSHPVLYAAQGSHGLWGSPGIHQYNNLPLLQDKTGKGTAWETWLNMDLIDVKDSLAMAQPHRHWLLYEGYWGNPSTRCHILMAGFCEFARGPTGIPRKRINFPCQNITVTSP